MTRTLDAATERALLEWIETRARERDAVHARGYQGETYLYEAHGRRLIIKVAPGRGARGWINRWMLAREHRAYQRLKGFPGSPTCHGLLRRRYLVLDYVEGVPLRRNTVVDRDAFFRTLLAYIEEMHRRGVAHADLKRKDNLLVVDGRRPCLIDFGAAVVRKPGVAPVNRYLYRLAQRFDFNAWFKFKYRGHLDDIAPEDRPYYRRTFIESVAGTLKYYYLAVRQLGDGKAGRHRRRRREKNKRRLAATRRR